MTSKNRNQLDCFAETPKRKPFIEPVTPTLVERIRMKPTFLDAWNYAQQVSTLEDKQVYIDLQIDASHWTKIGKGTASPPGDERFDQYLDIVQNEIPLIWWVEKRGYDWFSLRKHQDDAQKRIAELEGQLLEKERENRALITAFKSLKG